MNRKQVLVLGGAGFIGSTIAETLSEAGYPVTVLDGLLPRTGGNRRNTARLRSGVRIIEARVEEFSGLADLLRDHQIIVDSMGWTAHRLALRDPAYDLSLNLAAHIHWSSLLPSDGAKEVIYLGSRGQYGNPGSGVITEESVQLPEDVQGIHKMAAEMEIRLFCRLRKCSFVSLRIPNTFGEYQPLEGEDIGLVGGFIRDLTSGREVEVYGRGRRRTITYSRDLARIVANFCDRGVSGLGAFNIPGHDVVLEDLLTMLVRLVGTGSFTARALPDEIRAIDMGNAQFSAGKLASFLGELPMTPLETSLAKTVTYFRSSNP